MVAEANGSKAANGHGSKSLAQDLLAGEAEALAEVLEPEMGLLAGLDKSTFTRAVREMGVGLARHPLAAGAAGFRLATTLVCGGLATAARTVGVKVPPPVEAEKGDRRFSDAAWEERPGFFGLHQAYLAWARYMHELVEVSGVEGHTADRARLTVGLLVDGLAPTNFLLTNPVALRRAAETRGASAMAGFKNFLRDVSENGGKPRQVDTSAFTVGKDLASTPGKVVFQNDLMELIQYSPTTPTVHEVPLLLSPPWINKYYVMDLAPGRSFVEWAVSQGHTTFAISYRNPDETMRSVALDDYLLRGPHDALDVIAEITGVEQANIVGLCLGGTLTTMLLAHLAATDTDRVRSATLLNTLVDFEEPGPMGCFVDKESVERLDKKMLEKGYLEAGEMAGMFDVLRARDLIWSYVPNGWLMGEQPPAFDILYWNADSTRMPAEMHSFYLRYCYVENQLARDTMTLAGTSLHLKDVTADTYILSAREDHIAPWKSTYATNELLGGDTRFVLSSSGHIAGIVNPTGKSRRSHWLNEDIPADPDEWLAGATEHPGSWWEDWAAWIGARSGERRKPPRMGSRKYPPLADAPGSYVHQR